MIIACARPHLLAAALDPLRSAPPGTIEVAVAGDVGDVDPAHLPVPVRLIPIADRHTNVRRAAAIAATTAPLLAFLDDDATPMATWLEAALAVDPAASVVVTGPEEPASQTAAARLVHSVSSSRLAEATRAHTSPVAATVGWHEVPFCNCVVPRSVVAAVGPPSHSVAWDADDFEFFHRAREVATFRTDPELRITHDRYPDSVPAFLRAKWALRVRSGEKLVAHPGLYLSVPATVLAGVAPPFAALGLLAAGRRRRSLLRAGIVAYGLALATTVPGAVRRTGARSVPRHLGVLVGLHVVTATGVQVGLVRALLGRAGGPPTEIRPVEAPQGPQR